MGNKRKLVAGRHSPYKGVHLLDGNRRRPWQAVITKDGKVRTFGEFETAELAATAYNAAAIDLFGQFAQLNVIGQKVEHLERRTRSALSVGDR